MLYLDCYFLLLCTLSIDHVGDHGSPVIPNHISMEINILFSVLHLQKLVYFLSF